MDNKKYIIFLTVTLIISVLARILNPGWVLVSSILMFGIGPIYLFLFYMSNYRLIKKRKDNYEVLFYISCISLFIACVFYPDYMDNSKSAFLD